MSTDFEGMKNRYPRPHPDSAGRVLDGEAVVVTPSDSQMHTMNEVGTWIWERCDGSQSVADLVAGLVEEYEVDEDTARGDVFSFVRLLLDKGVLELLERPADDAG